MGNTFQHHVHLLPPTLQDISRLIGVDAAIAIAREYGGRRLYCPGTIPRGHRLAQLIGRQAAERLCGHFAHEHVSIPSARTYLRWYDARVLRTRKKTLPAISRELGITVSHVRTLLKGFTVEDEVAVEEELAHKRCPACGRNMLSARHHISRPTSQLDFGFPAA